ncbi:uncharacterized protein LOC143226911 [Tachypleus tridentatus]|uniref:uncharacterized protein LOC143226911 n=1 Tax=Tachypleus tridentatus TaxID=6853 RepID=UPI003FCF50E7
MDINDNIVCTVKLRSENVEHVAERQAVLKPKDRCVCFMHCKCTCIKDSLSCKLIKLEDYHKAGFRGSLPVLHTLKYHHNFTILFIIIVINILFLIIGFTKAAGGVILNRRVATFGIEFLVYRPKLLRQYIDKTLQESYEVVEYNEEGYPVHPETKERVRVTTIYEELLLNLFIVYLSPVLLIYFLSKRKRENSEYVPINQQSEDEISNTSNNSPELPPSEA